MSCVRCKNTSIVTYYSNSTDEVKKEFAVSNGISNPKSGAKGKKISTCISCISPPSRRKLHTVNAFDRYEFQFLNLLIDGINIVKKDYVFFSNKKNPSDNKQYDLMIQSNVVNHEDPIYLNIEVDEKGQDHGD
jgi:hypothetical protein